MKMQTPATSADAAPDPADIVIAQAEARLRRCQRWLIRGGIVALIACYPLSFRTILLLDRRGMLPNSCGPYFEAFYFPLFCIIESVPMVDYIFRCYLWSLGIDP